MANAASAQTADNWYLYDRLNRITLSQGELVGGAGGSGPGGTIQITAKQGISLGYDAGGNRRSATSLTSGSLSTDNYTYDADNRLIGTYRTGTVNGVTLTNALISGRAYDGAGRMTELTNYTTSGTGAAAVTSIDSRRVNTYNDNGWMTGQSSYNASNTLTQKVSYTGFDNEGNVTSYNVSVYTGTNYTNSLPSKTEFEVGSSEGVGCR